MKLPFVSRKKYENLEEVFENLVNNNKVLFQENSKFRGENKGLKTLLANAEDLRDAYKNRIDELYQELEENKKKEEHYNRSIAAFKFQSSRKTKKINELKNFNKVSTKSLKELDNLNKNLIERNRKLEKENLEYQEYIKQLSNEINKKKNKPTIEELKYENCLVEHHKLAGRRKNKERK